MEGCNKQMEFLFKNKQVSLSVVMVLIVSVVLFLHFRNAEDESVEDLFQQHFSDGFEQEEEVTVENDPTILIDIKGAIVKPGVYELKKGDRVYQAIDLAGGLLTEADQQQLNLAQLLQDEMVVYVPKLGEEPSNNIMTNINEPTNSQDGKIFINRVDAADLEKLPGIGPAKASAIFSYREENGAFKDINDLLHVSGIGKKTIEKLEEHLNFD
jgi:competence protein ComEA